MAAGSFVTWTHCSVRYKVTLRVNRRVRAEAPMRPRGLAPFRPPTPRPPLRPRRPEHVRADAFARTSSLLPPCPLACPALRLRGPKRFRADASMRSRGPGSLPPPVPLARSFLPASLPSLASAQTHADTRKLTFQHFSSKFHVS
jgi:hypothetical protein